MSAFRPSFVCLKATSRAAYPKRIQTGLYDGRAVLSGNAVGETFNNKTRRTWLPNSQTKQIWSEALGKTLRLRVTTGALRTIDKVGGLDAYLFRMRPERLGEKGMELRKLVQEAHKVAKTEARDARKPASSPASTTPAAAAEASTSV
ncbi:hypothetical protein MNV49_006049 [Pseudohyphozyma bogoriensis]|nr:hypothetical protein MNV49_006049 [Pseudohyphozyma bogoriensis]